MAAFDLLGVLQQARVGMASTDWKLFPLQRRAVIMNLISIWILGFFAIGVAMYLFVSSSAYVPRFLPDSFFSDTGDCSDIVDRKPVLPGSGDLAAGGGNTLVWPTDEQPGVFLPGNA